MNYIAGFSPTLVIGAFYSNQSNYIIVSHDHFENYDIIKVQEPADGRIVCMTTNSFVVYSVASLRNSLVLLTSVGIIQYNEGLYIIIPRCVTTAVISPQPLLTTKVVLLITHNNVSIATLGTKEYMKLHDASSPCDWFYTAINCSIVSGTVSGPGTVLFLVLVTEDSGSTYVVMAYEGDRWTLISYIPVKSVLYSGPWEHGFWPTEYNSSSHSSVDLELEGMTAVASISQDVYIWGNRILHSADDGKHWQVLSSYDVQAKVVLFTVSQKGQVALVNVLQQVWVGIQPTMFVELKACSYVDKFIISLYYDEDSNLIQLLRGVGDDRPIDRHTIPVNEILESLSFANKLQTQPIHNSTGVPTQECPFQSIQFTLPTTQQYSRSERFSWSSPALVDNMKLNTAVGLSAYQASVYDMLDEDFHNDAVYISDHPDGIERLKSRKESLQIYFNYLYQNKLLKDGIHLDLQNYIKVYENTSETIIASDLPDIVYLGRKQVYTFWIDIIAHEGGSVVYKMDLNQISVQLSDINLVQFQTRKTLFYTNRTVRHKVVLWERGSYVSQNTPGTALKPVGVSVRVWNTGILCVNSSKQQQQGFHSMTLMLGCPPKLRIIFDSKKSLSELTKYKEFGYDCLQTDPEIPCFYFVNGFYPYFSIVDEVTGKLSPFTGYYTLKVVGGSETSKNDIRLFTNSEIDAYNNISSANPRLVWGPQSADHTDQVGGLPLYRREKNVISWLCQPDSACANIHPNIPHSPEYFFLVELSNRKIDENSTYCDFTTRFVVHIHGLPIDNVYMALIITMASIAVLCLHVAAYFFCTKKNRLLWTSIKQSLLRRNRIGPQPEPYPKLPEVILEDEVLDNVNVWVRQAPSFTYSAPDDIPDEMPSTSVHNVLAVPTIASLAVDNLGGAELYSSHDNPENTTKIEMRILDTASVIPDSSPSIPACDSTDVIPESLTSYQSEPISEESKKTTGTELKTSPFTQDKSPYQ